jgi:hypothetical protein
VSLFESTKFFRIFFAGGDSLAIVNRVGNVIRMEKLPWSFRSISLNIPTHFLEGFTPLP